MAHNLFWYNIYGERGSHSHREDSARRTIGEEKQKQIKKTLQANPRRSLREVAAVVGVHHSRLALSTQKMEDVSFPRPGCTTSFRKRQEKSRWFCSAMREKTCRRSTTSCNASFFPSSAVSICNLLWTSQATETGGSNAQKLSMRH